MERLTAKILAPGEGERAFVVDHWITLKASSLETNGLFAFWEVEKPAGDAPPKHIHHDADESFYVLEGTFEVSLGDQTITARPGSYAQIPRGTLHTFKHIGEGIGRKLAFFAPGGADQFLVKLGKAIQEAGSLAATDIPQLMAMAKEYHFEPHLPPFHEVAQTTADRLGFHVPDGEGRIDPLLGANLRYLATSEQTEGKYALVEVNEAPQGGTPLHIHRSEDEAFYVVEGEFTLQIGNELVAAPKGSFAHLPKGTPHAYKNIGSTPGKLLVAITPGGFENFFMEASPARNDMNQIMEVAQRYGLEIIGPPIG